MRETFVRNAAAVGEVQISEFGGFTDDFQIVIQKLVAFFVEQSLSFLDGAGAEVLRRH